MKSEEQIQSRHGRLKRSSREIFCSIQAHQGSRWSLVWLRSDETGFSNKNKSQINYGLKRGARRSELVHCSLFSWPSVFLFFVPQLFNNCGMGEGGRAGAVLLGHGTQIKAARTPLAPLAPHCDAASKLLRLLHSTFKTLSFT